MRDRIRENLRKAGLTKEREYALHNTDDFLRRLKSTGEPYFYVRFSRLPYARITSVDMLEKLIDKKTVKSIHSIMRVSIFEIHLNEKTKEEIEAERAAMLRPKPLKMKVPVPDDLKEQSFVDKETMETYALGSHEMNIGNITLKAYLSGNDVYLQDEEGNYVQYLTADQYEKLKQKLVKEYVESLKKKPKAAPPPPPPPPPKPEPKKEAPKKNYSELEKHLGKFLEKHHASLKIETKKYKESDKRAYVQINLKKQFPSDWKILKGLTGMVNQIELQKGEIDDELYVREEGVLSVFMSNIKDEEGAIRQRLKELGKMLV